MQTMPVNSLLGQALLTMKQLARYNTNTSNVVTFLTKVVTKYGSVLNPKTSDQNSLTADKRTISNDTKFLKICMNKDYHESTAYSFKQNIKLEIYGRIKRNFGFERYLHSINNLDQRRTLTKLRIAGHRLPIEEGRKYDIPRHLRRCKLCSSTVVGDEFHVMMECTSHALQNLRQSTAANICNVIPQFDRLGTMDKFFYILSCADPLCTKTVAPALVTMFEIYNR